MPAVIRALIGNEQNQAMEYVFPGELATINIGNTAVFRNVLIVACDKDDLGVDLFETTMPEEADVHDTDMIASLCIPTNRICILEGECTDISYGGKELAFLHLDIEHFYSMTSS